jgi:ATP-dependent helicase/nuclease subunit B
MSTFDLPAALAAGVTVVTPNKRLARALAAWHDDAMRQRSLRTWPAARVLPWHAWQQTLWLDALAAGAFADPRPLLSEPAAAFLWDRIVAREQALLDPRGAAERAREAWMLFHAWREPHEAPAAWAHAGIADDAAAFARWAQRYAAHLDDEHAVDAAQAADALAAIAQSVPSWRDADVVLAGFLETTRQQQRLLAALAAAGTRVARVALPRPRSGVVRRIAHASPQAELAAALVDARARIEADPAARVAIVVGDLDDRRPEVIAAADDLLCPELAQQPGSDVPRPYAISLGLRLPDVPIVAAALALIEWSSSLLPLDAAAAVLRSPYLPQAEQEWQMRAAIELSWRRDGLRDVPFAVAVDRLSMAGRDPLAARWRSAVAPQTARAAPAAWADAWRAWLAALGWPGDRSLSSAEWQARARLFEALGEFAALGGLARLLSRDDAVHALRALIARIVFQPEAPPARIEILGVLEASGLEFDALWLAGMSAERWPPRVAPNPLLPLAWQRTRGVPRADAAHALAFAQAATAAFANAANEVTASHATTVDGSPAEASPLFAAWPAADDPGNARAGRAAAMAADRPALESLPDAVAPPLAEGSAVRGGVDIVESQSACAFQSFGRHRLHARTPAAPVAGLGPDERGTLLHRALKAFWDDVRDHTALAALTDEALVARIEAAVATARTVLDAQRWRALPPPVAAAESARLAATLHGWLTTIERERPAFAAVATEADARLALGGLVLSFRVDRVDALADGGVAIIDYKSGRVPAPTKWFAARPSGTQVGLYALARKDAAPEEPLRAAAYAQLKAGDVAVTGLAADADAWPGLRTPAEARGVNLATWPEVERFWRERYGALAAAFRAGDAAVLPRDAQACRYCDLQPVCRVQALDDAPREPEEDERDRG